MGTPLYGFQSLVKDDLVLSLKGDFEETISSWVNIIQRIKKHSRDKKASVLVTGQVVLNKVWRDSNFHLSIQWKDGNVLRLTNNTPSKYVTFKEKVFVLDRECVGSGSRVCLAGHPEIEGIVKEKRYLATGRCFTEDNEDEVVFEDVDIKCLRPLLHKGELKNTKILYNEDWLGIVTNFKLRLKLKLPTHCPITLVLDGNLAQKYNIGEKIILGYNLLRSGLVIDNANYESNHWLLNSLIFWNVSATVVDIETEQLEVKWIGRKGEPILYPTSYDFPNAPSTIIPYNKLEIVKYLFGEKSCQVTPYSLWLYNHNPDLSENGKDSPISVEKYQSKWKKMVDYDRWEYPIPQDISQKYQYWDEDVILQILHVRSVVEVSWKNGIVSTLNSGDVVPLYLETLWKDWAPFKRGVIVKDRLEVNLQEKYGMILEVNGDETATVKWVVPGHNGNTLMTELQTVPLYNLEEKVEFKYISRLNQSPLVYFTGEDYKLGVVTGTDAESGQVYVSFPGTKERSVWPHQLIHYQCDVLICPIEKRPAAWYDHVTLVEDLCRVAPKSKTTCMNEMPTISVRSQKKKLTFVENLPEDNAFISAVDAIPKDQFDECFQETLTHELIEIEKSIPDGMWIEFYSEPRNILSALMIGPKGSLFEDFPFIFDLFLFNDFPTTDVHINFRSMGITLLPELFCKTGGVYLPENTRFTENYSTCSDILNFLLEVKNFMAIPLHTIHAMQNEETFAFLRTENKFNGSDELFKFVLMAVLDYALALLRHPPQNWATVIYSHFEEALPRIIARFKQSQENLKNSVDFTPGSEKGDFPKSPLDMNTSKSTSESWNDSFTKSIHKRILQLEEIAMSMNVLFK